MSAPQSNNWQRPGADATGGTPAYSTAPAYETAGYAEQPQSRSKAVGRVALALALIDLVGTVAIAITASVALAGYSANSPEGASVSFDINSADPAEASLAVLTLVQWVGGGLLGFWAFIQGIVAVASRRGRAAGVWAIVIAVLAPGIALAAEAIAAVASHH